MKLTALPFDSQTGELLPVYRDAYLRGDLSRASAQAVEEYLHRDAGQAHSTVTRWHQLQDVEDATATPSWVQQQLQFIRKQPQRFRRRAFSLVTVGALLAGVSMAASNRPAIVLPLVKVTSASALPAAASLETMAAPAAARTVLVHGRILNEKGQPLAGATVLHKGTAQGTSTDAQGNYSLRVPADGAATLQYGYGGYTEQEVAATHAAGSSNVTLQPRATKRRHWLFF